MEAAKRKDLAVSATSSSASFKHVPAVAPDAPESSRGERGHAERAQGERGHSMVVPKGTAVVGPDDASSLSVADALVDALIALGVEQAFGVFGGGIAPFCDALNRSSVRLMHFRHEAGAAFAAIEASLASGKPTVVLATTGPGITNLYTGMVAARAEGATVLFVSGCTPPAQRGRGSFQDTSHTSPLAPLFVAGATFHFAKIVENPAELDAMVSRLASGVRRPHGFVAHIGMSLGVQTAQVEHRRTRVTYSGAPPCDGNTLALCRELLSSGSFVIWAGFGARHAAARVRKLAELSGAKVICSPRGKGIMPEDSPLFLGVTGLGGHASVDEYMQTERPERALVLGSKLGELTSFWSPELVPEHGFIHVDLDADAFGAAYPNAPTLGVQAEIGAFLDALLEDWPTAEGSPRPAPVPRWFRRLRPRESGPVRPSFLMEAVQREIVEATDVVVLTEAGNSFTLGSHHLRFPSSGRYRVSTSFGSMGQAAAGVLGAALGSNGKAVAILGDGAMLMQNEISTAATYGIDAVWIVLNDARYAMIAQGMAAIGWEPFETDFARADFVAIARAMGGEGVRVEREVDVQLALRAALAARGPFVVDVLIDRDELAPSNRRNQSLVSQGVNGSTTKEPA